MREELLLFSLFFYFFCLLLPFPSPLFLRLLYSSSLFFNNNDPTYTYTPYIPSFPQQLPLTLSSLLPSVFLAAVPMLPGSINHISRLGCNGPENKKA